MVGICYQPFIMPFIHTKLMCLFAGDVDVVGASNPIVSFYSNPFHRFTVFYIWTPIYIYSVCWRSVCTYFQPLTYFYLSFSWIFNAARFSAVPSLISIYQLLRWLTLNNNNNNEYLIRTCRAQIIIFSPKKNVHGRQIDIFSFFTYSKWTWEERDREGTKVFRKCSPTTHEIFKRL